MTFYEIINSRCKIFYSKVDTICGKHFRNSSNTIIAPKIESIHSNGTDW